MKEIYTPLSEEAIITLSAGDEVRIYGVVYTLRDAAHKRLLKTIERKEPLPFNINEATIYYTGPTPPPPGKIIGACGPTTASRMDIYTPHLLKLGLRGMIGKGPRSKDVCLKIAQHHAIYFFCIGGAGAFLSKYIKEVQVMAYEDLGPEAIYQLKLDNFPAYVGVDCRGNVFP